MSTDASPIFDPSRERYALSRAYVPEHIPALMATVSRAAPFLIEDYLGYAKDNWVIFVGYPLETPFDPALCDERIARALELHHPEYLWFIGPGIPPSLTKPGRSRQSDQYLRLDLAGWKIKSSLQRGVNQAAKALTVEHAREFTREHRSLVDELARRAELPPLVAELYRSIPDYVAGCETALVLNARDAKGKLSAFFVIECAAERFDTYVLGCYSKVHYIPHASDLLFAEMVAYARERGKSEINLGLGVNAGIRRFKTKWGGVPYLKYEFCECYYGPPKQLSVLEMLLKEKL
ncbi:MAG: hypothetical protein JW963_25590 [Anaerolineales bacterium]|nr:hypothetical protein [Anaerolineales bacterium]